MLKPFIRITKPIYNYAKRSPLDVSNVLKLAAAEAMRKNPGYTLHEFKGPVFLPDGVALYVIKLKICASLIQ